ncbi:MAG: hypothetical protein PUJ57_02160 [Peptoniphilaceae bacterium]|nr:hypothetical protein [Peptoniphilaceae bacterium]
MGQAGTNKLFGLAGCLAVLAVRLTVWPAGRLFGCLVVLVVWLFGCFGCSTDGLAGCLVVLVVWLFLLFGCSADGLAGWPAV